MSAIVTLVLEGTLGFLAKKGRQGLAEKLRGGDVTDEQLRGWIIREIDDVNSKLDAFARSDLKASISFFRGGLVHLKAVIGTETSGEGSMESDPEDIGAEKEKMPEDRRFTDVTSAGVDALTLAQEMSKLNVFVGLCDSRKKALNDARKRFSEARYKATEAFNNENLSPSDRILASAVRLMATVLENVENPRSALEECKLGLEELHSTSMVQENFNAELTQGFKAKLNKLLSKNERREIISLVCQLNRIIYDIALVVGKKGEHVLLPCVVIANEKVDPLRDARVVAKLRKVGMDNCSVVWSFALEEERYFRNIATNTRGQFLFTDRNCVEVFDTNGSCLFSFALPKEDRYVHCDIMDVATDENDNFYVLACDRTCNSCYIYAFDKKASFRRKFLVESEFRGTAVIVRGNHLFVLGNNIYKTSVADPLSSYVVALNRDGEKIAYISKGVPESVIDVAAVDSGNIVLLAKFSSWVCVFADLTEAVKGGSVPAYDKFGNPLVEPFVRKFTVAPWADAIAYHHTTGHLIVASKTPQGRSQVLLYSKEGKLVRSIDIELDKREVIRAATASDGGRICILTRNKVLVL